MKRLFTIIGLACLLLPATLAAKKQVTVINVIPYPQSVEIGKGSFKASGANFNCDLNIDVKSQKAIKEFADKITFVSGRTCSFAVPVGLSDSFASGKIKGFLFLKDDSLGPEEYSIEITKKSCLVKASSHATSAYHRPICFLMASEVVCMKGWISTEMIRMASARLWSTSVLTAKQPARL